MFSAKYPNANDLLLCSAVPCAAGRRVSGLWTKAGCGRIKRKPRGCHTPIGLPDHGLGADVIRERMGGWGTVK